MWKNFLKPLTPPIILDLYRKLRSQGLFQGASHPLSKAEIQRLFPGIETVPAIVHCAHIIAVPGQLPLTESVVLASICKYLKPRRIFEIGTYRGASTLTMAMNTPADTEILTLDLDPAQRGAAKYGLEMGDITGMPFTVGCLYRGTDSEAKIRQLYGDSALFDFAPFYRTADLVFIDGNHAYENVKSDSNNAFRIVRKGGVVIWDDYHPECGPGVMRYLSKLNNPKGVFQIVGTRFALYMEK
jgi:predicted O-methyltransferase YrrM